MSDEVEQLMVSVRYDLTGDQQRRMIECDTDRLEQAFAELLALRSQAGEPHVDEETPPELLASKLIDAWVADKGKKIPWAKCVQIVAIVTKQPDAERDRLLRMGDKDDGCCEMCGRSDTAPPSQPVKKESQMNQEFWWLIESNKVFTGVDKPGYATGAMKDGYFEWTLDPYKAARFATEDAAQTICTQRYYWDRDRGGYSDARAVEHGFINAAQPGAVSEAYKRGYEYLQHRMESIGRAGWAHDYDGEIAAAPRQPEAQPTADNYVAWCRYVTAQEKPPRIALCDSNDEGAFKVYRHAQPGEDEAKK